MAARVEDTCIRRLWRHYSQWVKLEGAGDLHEARASRSPCLWVHTIRSLLLVSAGTASLQGFQGHLPELGKWPGPPESPTFPGCFWPPVSHPPASHTPPTQTQIAWPLVLCLVTRHEPPEIAPHCPSSQLKASPWHRLSKERLGKATRQSCSCFSHLFVDLTPLYPKRKLWGLGSAVSPKDGEVCPLHCTLVTPGLSFVLWEAIAPPLTI